MQYIVTFIRQQPKKKQTPWKKIVKGGGSFSDGNPLGFKRPHLRYPDVDALARRILSEYSTSLRSPPPLMRGPSILDSKRSSFRARRRWRGFSSGCWLESPRGFGVVGIRHQVSRRPPKPTRRRPTSIDNSLMNVWRKIRRGRVRSEPPICTRPSVDGTKMDSTGTGHRLEPPSGRKAFEKGEAWNGQVHRDQVSRRTRNGHAIKEPFSAQKRSV